jgi:DNA-binding winged helix-turn-helix (wHTH) protein/Tfp pilus assembly protein PilF
MLGQTQEVFVFGPFRVDASERALTQAGAPLHVTPKVFDLLVCFLRNRGRLLTKDQLLVEVWGDVVVEESALARAVSDLRKVLGAGHGTSYIETVPKFGYRFVSPVQTEHGWTCVPAVEPQAVAGAGWTGRWVPIALAGLLAVAPIVWIGQRLSSAPVVSSTGRLPSLRSEAEESALREHYLRGRGYWRRRDRESLKSAVAEFQKAISTDPNYAHAHAGLADCYLLLGLYNHLPLVDMLPRARAEAEEALKLDPKLAAAHATLGLITQNWERDWPSAERHYRAAISGDPGYATARHWYAEFLSIHGRFQESAAQFQEAKRIDPISSIIQTDEAQMLYFARSYGRSRSLLDRVIELDPEFEQAHEQMALLYTAQGMETQAWDEVNRISSCKDPNSTCYLRWQAWLPHRDSTAARSALQRLLAEFSTRYVPPRTLAIAFVRQGQTGQAISMLARAVEGREVGAITMKVDPLLDPVRKDPRFQRLLQRLHL